jgi:phosphoglycerate dehydrogenase-like enzyme
MQLPYGALINENALIRALKEGWIAGAGLDVFETEPLPEDSELYELPNVILTPHMSAHTTALFDRCVDVFCENLRRYTTGQPLLNVVNRG